MNLLIAFLGGMVLGVVAGGLTMALAGVSGRIAAYEDGYQDGLNAALLELDMGLEALR